MLVFAFVFILKAALAFLAQATLFVASPLAPRAHALMAGRMADCGGKARDPALAEVNYASALSLLAEGMMRGLVGAGAAKTVVKEVAWTLARAALMPLYDEFEADVERDLVPAGDRAGLVQALAAKCLVWAVRIATRSVARSLKPNAPLTQCGEYLQQIRPAAHLFKWNHQLPAALTDLAMSKVSAGVSRPSLNHVCGPHRISICSGNVFPGLGKDIRQFSK